MSDLPQQTLNSQGIIATASLESLGIEIRSLGTGFTTSVVWPLANRALFVPFSVTQPILVNQMFVYNGTAVSGNIDVGLYDSAGTRLVSAGSTAQSGTSTLQVFDVTDTMLDVGVYYFAVALNNTTGIVAHSSLSGNIAYSEFMGVYQMASAFPLPATATFAKLSTAYVPQAGLTIKAVV